MKEIYDSSEEDEELFLENDPYLLDMRCLEFSISKVRELGIFKVISEGISFLLTPLRSYLSAQQYRDEPLTDIVINFSNVPEGTKTELKFTGVNNLKQCMGDFILPAIKDSISDAIAFRLFKELKNTPPTGNKFETNFVFLGKYGPEIVTILTKIDTLKTIVINGNDLGPHGLKTVITLLSSAFISNKNIQHKKDINKKDIKFSELDAKNRALVKTEIEEHNLRITPIYETVYTLFAYDILHKDVVELIIGYCECLTTIDPTFPY